VARIIELKESCQGDDEKSFIERPIKKLIDARKAVKREPLTIEKVRSVNVLKDLSETEAAEVVGSIKKLTALLFDMHCRKEQTCIDNQQVVCLNQENKAA